jgi:hypothetical protein
MPGPGAAHPGVHEELREMDELPHQETARYFVQRGELHRLEHEFADARANYDRAARIDPDYPPLALARAAVLLDTGDPAACDAALVRFLDTHPLDTEALELRSRARAGLARFEEAAADLATLSREADRVTPDLYHQQASWLIAAGPAHWDEALEALEQGIERLGPIVSLETDAAEVESRLGRFEDARRRVDRMALARGPIPRPAPESVPASARVASVAAQLTRGPYLQSGSLDRVTVRWRTDAAITSMVRFGRAGGPLDAVFTGPVTDEHIMTLSGLDPETDYVYQVDLGGPTPFETYVQSTFKTAPYRGSLKPTRVWVIGDAGTATVNQLAVRDAWEQWHGNRDADLWLMLGDNAYEGGTDAEYQTAVFDVYGSLLSRRVVWPTRGNHDVVYAGANNDYYDIFTLPTLGECGGLASGSEAYYSFDYANIHFVCLDSEGSNRTRGFPMMRWLESDLAATNQQWVIAYWHHPPYTKGSHDSDDPLDSGGRMMDMRQVALGIMDSAGVDLVLNGHSHSYERSFLLNGHYGTSNTLTPQMIVDGGDGRIDGDGGYHKLTPGRGPFEGAVYAVAGSSGQVSSGPLNHPVMVTSMLSLGSMVLDVNGTELDARFIDETGTVRDSFAIIKTPVSAVPGPGIRERPSFSAVWPNPAHGTMRLAFEAPSRDHARLSVVDVGGRRVRSLLDGTIAAGRHEVAWDTRDGDGHAVRPGIYFLVLEQGGARAERRIAVTR